MFNELILNFSLNLEKINQKIINTTSVCEGNSLLFIIDQKKKKKEDKT